MPLELTVSNLFIGQNRIYLADTDSTNNYARKLVRAKMPIEGTVITTEEQTHGRGQRSNLWISEPKMNLTCSYILRPVFLAAKDQFLLSASVALAVFDVVSMTLPDQDVKIKWPNDILIGQKKVAGILIENSLRGNMLDNSIVGIGININQVSFPSNLKATSLKTEVKKTLSIDDVLTKLNRCLERRYLQIRSGGGQAALSSLNKNLFGFEQERMLIIKGVQESVLILGARPSGELQLQHQDGSNTLYQHHEIEWLL